jgi:hypothetical protein
MLYAQVLARMLELGSEYFPMMMTIDSVEQQKPKQYTNPPMGRRLQQDALITNEINAILGAQQTQVCQPIVMGRVPEAWKPVIELHREVYAAGLSMIKPGMTFGALHDWVNDLGAQRGMKTVMQLMGCGYGDDGPLFKPQSNRKRDSELMILKGNALVWKPIAMSADQSVQFTWGGPVLVNEDGAEVLFHGQPGMISIV